jgi:hypothetical protein
MLSLGARVAYAFRCFFSLLLRGTIPPDVAARLAAPPPVRAAGPAPAAPAEAPRAAPPAAPVQDTGDRAVQLLALLQREGRLVDFLREDLGAYADAQVGAAVRSVHAGCREVLDRYLGLEPILADEEGVVTQVGAGVSPSAVKLVGAVATHGAVRGVVRHRGWRVGRIELPPLPSADARPIVSPAEVEVA